MAVDEEFLSLMYGSSDDEARTDVSNADATPEEKAAAGIKANGILSLATVSSLIRSQAQSIARLSRMIAEKDRRIRQLEGRVRRLEAYGKSTGRSLDSLEGQMSNKLDRRDW